MYICSEKKSSLALYRIGLIRPSLWAQSLTTLLKADLCRDLNRGFALFEQFL